MRALHIKPFCVLHIKTVLSTRLTGKSGYRNSTRVTLEHTHLGDDFEGWVSRRKTESVNAERRVCLSMDR